MDVVVVLALVVLVGVFLVSCVVLYVMCRRRRAFIKEYTETAGRGGSSNNNPLPSTPSSAVPAPNLDGLRRKEPTGNLVEMTPIMADSLSRNEWLFGVSGPLQHSVALLKLSHSLCDHLASINTAQMSLPLSAAVLEAAQQVMPRFDSLLAATASPTIDVRLLEACATSLATVCWAVLLPYRLHNVRHRDDVRERLEQIDEHLGALRQAVASAEQAQLGKVNVDWSRVDALKDDEEEDEDEEDARTQVTTAGGGHPQNASSVSPDAAAIVHSDGVQSERAALLGTSSSEAANGGILTAETPRTSR